MKRSIIFFVAIISILAGLIGILAVVVVTPDFASKYLSPDHHITEQGYRNLNMIRLFSLCTACMFLFVGILFVKFQDRISQTFFVKSLSYPASLPLKIEVPLCLFLSFLGFLLRIYNIGDLPLWLDEAYSQWFAEQTLTDLWTYISRFEPNSPLYCSILHGWVLIFGDSEAGLRSLSAVFGTFTIPLVYLLGRLVGGSWAGAGTALLLATSPLHLQYSQEARTYAALTFTVAMMLVGLAWLMRHAAVSCHPILSMFRAAISFPRLPTLANPPISPRRGALAWCCFIIGCAATLWLHNTSVFVVLTVNLIVFFFFAHGLHWNKQFLTNWLIANIIVLVLWAPYWPWLWPIIHKVSQGFWIKKPELSTVFDIIRKLYGLNYSYRLKPFVDLGAVALVVGGLLWLLRAKQWNWLVFIVAILFLPLLMQFFVSLVFTPVLIYRTLIPLTIAFFLAIGIAISRLGRLTLILPASAFIAIVSVKACLNYYEGHRKEPWDRIAATVAEAGRDGDVVLLNLSGAKLPFDYYFQKHLTGLPTLGLPEDYPMRGVGNRPMTVEDLSRLRQILHAYSRFWLITYRPDLFDPDKLIEKELQQNRHIIRTETFFPKINLRLYQ